MLIQPPASSPLPNLFARLAEATTRLSTARAWTITLVALTLASIGDRLTGPLVNFMPILLLIASFAAWSLGEKAGCLIGLAAIALNSWSNGLGADRGLGLAAIFWNMSWRIVVMSLLVVLASGMRCALDQARWSAATDGLTGVLNKGAFSRRLGPLVSQAQRRGDSLVVAYIDLDGFKGVNDGFGHAAGDALLRQFATSAVIAIRAHDLFARIGGDEFIALLTVPTCPQGDIAAERLHDRLTRILHETGHAVTCSIGALVLDSRQVAQPERLVETADELMYEVKHSGKNALRIARADLQPGALAPALRMPDRRWQPAAVGQAA